MQSAGLLAMLLFITPALAQFFPKPGGAGGQPPDVVNASTNRLDIDVNGTTDFEIVQQSRTTYVQGIGGWTGYTTATVSLIPVSGGRILVSDSSDPIGGNVPILEAGTQIGPTDAGRHWATNDQVLVTRAEPMFLNGPLAPVWAGAPGKFHIGISLGTSDAPVYGWLCFARESGTQWPFNWGYARATGEPVISGDAASAPPITLSLTRNVENNLLILTWKPSMPGIVVEEGSLTNGTDWKIWGNASNSELAASRILFQSGLIPGETRLFRARVIP